MEHVAWSMEHGAWSMVLGEGCREVGIGWHMSINLRNMFYNILDGLRYKY